ncbi:MAG: histidine kinase [Bacteroidia bacterium]|nr:histidine kinase [Bacteroidia bacterium]
MIYRNIFIFSFFLFYGSFFTAQNFPVHYRIFNQENGLTKNNILQIIPFENGKVGLLTEDALFVHDGYMMEKWISSDQTGAPLSYLYFNNSKIYVLTKNKGIFIYDSSGKTLLKRIPMDQNQNANQLLVHEGYIFLLISKVRLLVIDEKEGVPLDFPEMNNIRPATMKCFSGKLWVGHDKGLLIFENKHFRKIQKVELAVDFIHPSADTAFICSGEKIFILKNEVLRPFVHVKFPGKGGIFLPGGEREILFLNFDRMQRFWLVPSPGDELFLFHPERCISIHASNALPTSFITDVQIDALGNLWLGTFDVGAISIREPVFEAVSISKNSKNIIPEHLYFDGLSLFISSSNGFFEYNPLTRELHTVVEPDPVFQYACGPCVEHLGNLYLPTLAMLSGSKSKIITKRGKQIVTVPAKKIFLIDNEFYATDVYENILHWNSDFTKPLDTLFSLADFRIRVNALKKINQDFYVLTNKGIYIKEQKQWKVWPGTQNFHCLELIESKNEKILIHQGGVMKILSDHTLLPLINQDGVLSYAKNGNKIYLAGSFGVLEADSAFKILHKYNRFHGLLSQTIRHLIFSKGFVFIAGANGIQYSDLKKLKDKVTPLSINRILIGDSLQEFGRKIYVKKDQTLKILVTCPEFFFPELREFYYTVNDGNVQKSNQPTIVLNELKGGHSKIKIWATESSEVFLEIEKEKKFIETPFFWASLGILVLGISGTITWLLYGRIRRKVKQKLEEERSMNLLKHQAMNALLSPHFIFNSLTSIQHYINSNNPLKASEYLAKFSRLIRMIIERAADPDIPLNIEIQRLRFYLDLEKERFSGKFDYVLEADDALLELNPSLPNMIVQPYAENAILHGILPKGEGGLLKIFFRKEGNFIKIIVEDNGVGLSQSKNAEKRGHKSIATATIKNILELNARLKNLRQEVHMEELKNDAGLPAGTRVTITLEMP